MRHPLFRAGKRPSYAQGTSSPALLPAAMVGLPCEIDSLFPPASDIDHYRFVVRPPQSVIATETTFAAAPICRSRSRSAVGGYAVSVKAEPVGKHKESGVILDLTGRGHRLNNRAAILQSKIT